MQGEAPTFCIMLQDRKGQYVIILISSWVSKQEGKGSPTDAVHLYWLILIFFPVLQRHHFLGQDHQNVFWLICFPLTQLCQMFSQWLGMPRVSLAMPPRENGFNKFLLRLTQFFWTLWETDDLALGPVVGNGEEKEGEVTSWCSGTGASPCRDA